MADIQIDYTPQYAGDHRICFRKQNLTVPDAYCCIIDNTPSTVGVPKTFTFTIGDPPCPSVPLVDNESCDSQIYEGYVQPACELETSNNNRVAWNTQFAINPTCRAWSALCDNTGILELGITDPGYGYDPVLSPIAGVIFGGIGAGATAEIIIGDGLITSLAITAPGSGYTDGAYTVNILESAAPLGATADITVLNGEVISLTLNVNASGYTGTAVNSTLDVSGIGAGVGFTYDIITDYSIVIDTNVTAPGSGYDAVTPVTFPAPTLPGPVQSTGTVVGFVPCPGFLNNDCQGGSDTLDPIPFLDTVVVCQVGSPTVGSDIVLTDTGPCCGCTTYEVVSGPDPLDASPQPVFWYTDCDRNLIEITLNWSDTISVCAITGSHLVNKTDTVTVTVTPTGSC